MTMRLGDVEGAGLRRMYCSPHQMIRKCPPNLPLKLLHQSRHQCRKAQRMEKRPSPQALRIAFGMVFKQLAALMASILALAEKTGSSHWRNVCCSGDPPVAFRRKFACQFEYKPFRFFIRYSQGVFLSFENDLFFSGVDFFFRSQARADGGDSVDSRVAGHLVYETIFRKGSQNLDGVWRHHFGCSTDVLEANNIYSDYAVWEMAFSHSACHNGAVLAIGHPTAGVGSLGECGQVCPLGPFIWAPWLLQFLVLFLVISEICWPTYFCSFETSNFLWCQTVTLIFEGALGIRKLETWAWREHKVAVHFCMCTCFKNTMLAKLSRTSYAPRGSVQTESVQPCFQKL